MIPPPNYDYEISKLVSAYEEAFEDILRKLESVDLTDFQRAQQLALLQSVGETLKGLNEAVAEWVETNMKVAASDGIARAIVELGIVATIQEAQTLVRFSEIHTAFVNAIIADTQADLLASTTFVSNKIRAAVRQVAGEILRGNNTRGINGTATLKREFLAGLREKLGKAAQTGIIDARGYRWKPTDYADMVVRTKMMQAHRESTINEAIKEEAYYGVISKHGAKDACSKWEGKVVKLVADAPGDYPYINDLPRREIFHPRCKHVVSPVRKPERYS